MSPSLSYSLSIQKRKEEKKKRKFFPPRHPLAVARGKRGRERLEGIKRGGYFLTLSKKNQGGGGREVSISNYKLYTFRKKGREEGSSGKKGVAPFPLPLITCWPRGRDLQEKGGKLGILIFLIIFLLVAQRKGRRGKGGGDSTKRKGSTPPRLLLFSPSIRERKREREGKSKKGGGRVIPISLIRSISIKRGGGKKVI